MKILVLRANGRANACAIWLIDICKESEKVADFQHVKDQECLNWRLEILRSASAEISGRQVHTIRVPNEKSRKIKLLESRAMVVDDATQDNRAAPSYVE